MNDLGQFVMPSDEPRLAIFEIAEGDGYSSVLRFGRYALYPMRHENGNLYFSPRPEGGPASGTERVLVAVKDPIPVGNRFSEKPPGMPQVISQRALEKML